MTTAIRLGLCMLILTVGKTASMIAQHAISHNMRQAQQHANREATLSGQACSPHLLSCSACMHDMCLDAADLIRQLEPAAGMVTM